MSNDANPHRWFTGWRTREAPVVDDPADMGTAFGLDLSLNELPHEAGAVAAGDGPSPGWMQRLTGRHKPGG